MTTPHIETTQTLPPTETRPWGQFTVLADLPHYKAKELVVNPGHRLSLQLHHKREEHWLVVSGKPTVTVDEKTWDAQPGEYIHIPTKARHRLTNSSSEPAVIVEVQLGQYFGEDDIVRFQDDYQREVSG